MPKADVACVVNIVLYSFSEAANAYDEYGPVSCAIIGSKDTERTYKLGCYRDNKYICTANITASNDAGAHIARDAAYVTFRDDVGHYWSLQFDSEDAAIQFCAQVTVAMFGAAGEPKDSILACDIVQGKETKHIFVGDLVKAFYRVWVVQCSEARDELPRLGSLLEKECEDAVKFAAPANHQGVTPSMRGFEGMTIGMREGGQRLIVVPSRARRGRGPNVSMCFYIEVSRRKDQQVSSKSGGGHMSQHANALQFISRSEGMSDDRRSIAGSSPQALAITGGATDAYAAFAANGFSKEQFLMVDRLRDQVFTLNEQLRDARRELDNVTADLKRHAHQTGTRSLTSVQIEYSVEQLLTCSESKKSTLEDKRVLIGEAEARNRELEARLSKFLQTIKTLEDEVRATSDESTGERIELDRQLGDTQAKLVRLDGEIGDSGRHLQALKNMIRANDLHLKETKTQLSVSMGDHQVNAERLHTLQENYSDESGQRKLLESQLLALQEELRRYQDDAQLKETLALQIKTKTENDTTHYSQLIQQEREQAMIELRQLKQDLMEELAARNRQYDEAKERVAVEAYEQGMAQGVEEGLADAANEGDVIAHDLAVNAQRCKAEAAALQVRLQANRAANDADERRLRSQLESVQSSLARTLQDGNSLATQLEVLQTEYAAKVGVLYQRLSRLVYSCGSAPISQPCLTAMMRAAETGSDFDPHSFQQVESAKESQLAQEERAAVSAWVRASVYSQPTRLPPLRPPFPLNVSSKGPLMSAEMAGTKVLLDPGAEVRRVTLASALASMPSAAPSSNVSVPAAAPSKIGNAAASPLAPAPAAAEPAASVPEPIVNAPHQDLLFRASATTTWERLTTGAFPSAASTSRVRFPSTKIRYFAEPNDDAKPEPPLRK